MRLKIFAMCAIYIQNPLEPVDKHQDVNIGLIGLKSDSNEVLYGAYYRSDSYESLNSNDSSVKDLKKTLPFVLDNSEQNEDSTNGVSNSTSNT